jgi:hypothetical protein
MAKGTEPKHPETLLTFMGHSTIRGPLFMPRSITRTKTVLDRTIRDVTRLGRDDHTLFQVTALPRPQVGLGVPG